VAPGTGLAYEADTPAEQRRHGAHPQQQRGILAADRAQQLAEHTGTIPRIDEARVQQRAVAKARLLAGSGSAIDHGHLHAVSTQKVGGRYAEQAATDDDYASQFEPAAR